MSSRRKSSSTGGIAPPKMDATRKRITQMEQEREERRKSMIQRKQARKLEQQKNLAAGNPGDVDFIGMVEEWRCQQAKDYKQQQPSQKAQASTGGNICIAVRKRPVSEKERQKQDHDSVSCFPPQVTIHSAKFKVDGITKYLTHNSFQFDHAFGPGATTEDIYVQTTLPLVDHVVSTQGRATVFCYGQTGSGKTYTMNGIQQILAYDLYAQLGQEPNAAGYETTVAFFELYGGFIQDLLHQRQRCKLLEDGKGEVNITGLQEVPASTPEDFLRILDEGNSLRTTQKTEANDTSSRSHAICQVLVRQNGKLKGKLSLVDLAGSERGSDTKSHNSQRRTESADINTSLLSLKECMRALGEKSAHVPYRGSKLTLILKDCFSPDSKTTMITTVSPGASSTDHSLNTLRYADRIKEQRTTTTPATTAPNNKTNRMGGGGAKSPRPAPPPSKQRLQRISNANALAKERRPVPVAVDALSHSAGLVEALNSPTFLVEEDEDDDELLLTDSGGAISRQGQEMEDEDDDDEDYAPSDEELEEDHYYTPTASEEAAEEPVSGGQTTMKEDEEEMRRIVQALFELEEALLNQHMSNIQEHAEMLTEEGKLLQSIQPKVSSEEEVDDYAIQLAEYLDRKEILIYKLQGKLGEFKNQLAKEQQMAQRVHTLSQY